MRKPSAYVRDITDGTFSSTGHVNVPTYPRGLPMPTENSAMTTLVELEDDPTRTKGETRPNEPLMALACNAGANPTNLNDAHSRKDWPEWDASINWELEQHANLRTWDLVEPPDGANIVGSRFVFHYKHDSRDRKSVV